MSYRVVVLVSGGGTLLQALIDARDAGELDAELVAVGSDVPGCPALARAEAAAITHFAHLMPTLLRRGSAERLAWDGELAELVAAHRPDLVVSAGFMKLFDAPFMGRFEGRIINTHPALLPAFPGAHAVRDALAAGAEVTGASIFWVNDGVDTGELITQQAVAVEPGDTEETLHERIKVVERRLLVQVLNDLASQSHTEHTPAGEPA